MSTVTATPNAYVANFYQPVLGRHFTPPREKPRGYYKLPLGTEYITQGGDAVSLDNVTGDRYGNRIVIDGYRYHIYVREESFAERIARLKVDETPRHAAPASAKRPEDFDDWG